MTRPRRASEALRARAPTRAARSISGFDELPERAAWSHVEARDGFEVVFFRRTSRGWRLAGHTTAVEHDEPWTVRYEIAVDARWRTRAARVWCWHAGVPSQVSLRHDGFGRWTVAGKEAADLDGCIDIDLESSACTNTLPVHRMAPDHARFSAPAAYVRVNGEVQRLEQTYRRRSTAAERRRFDYRALQFDFACELTYDRHGLLLDYPGIARRVL